MSEHLSAADLEDAREIQSVAEDFGDTDAADCIGRLLGVIALLTRERDNALGPHRFGGFVHIDGRPPLGWCTCQEWSSDPNDSWTGTDEEIMAQWRAHVREVSRDG